MLNLPDVLLPNPTPAVVDHRHRVDDGGRTRGLHLGKVPRYQLRHIHISPLALTATGLRYLPGGGNGTVGRDERRR